LASSLLILLGFPLNSLFFLLLIVAEVVIFLEQGHHLLGLLGFQQMSIFCGGGAGRRRRLTGSNWWLTMGKGMKFQVLNHELNCGEARMAGLSFMDGFALILFWRCV
jgi:hypothetical protein